jgi:broad specificity phosphatase PhoE
MRLYIVRHGESVDDIEDCYGGVADFALTDKGRQQARDAAERLRHAKIDVVYSSPLRRARESAEIIAAALSAGPIVVIDDLQERNTYGVLSGVNKKRADELFHRVLAQLKEKPGYSRETILGGEEYESFVARVRHALDAVSTHATEHRVTTAVVLTHGKFTQALFERVFQLGADVMPQLSAVNAVEFEPARTTWVGQPAEAV